MPLEHSNFKIDLNVSITGKKKVGTAHFYILRSYKLSL